MWKKISKIATPEPSQYEQWWDGLSSHTKTSLKDQPIWHDRDLYKAVALGIAVGLIVGFMFGLELASPDYSTMPQSYVKG